MKKNEIWVRIPKGQRLVGVRTEDDTVIITIEPEQNVTTIGFIRPPSTEDSNE